MATKSIKSYDSRLGKARSKKRKMRKFAYTADMGKYDQAKADLAGAEIDRDRLMRKKPKGMSAEEWARQVRSGEAMVQNPSEAKMKPVYKRFVYDKAKQVKASGSKKPKEFVITTMREPKLLKKAAKVRAKQRRRK